MPIEIKYLRQEKAKKEWEIRVKQQNKTPIAMKKTNDGGYIWVTTTIKA